MLDYGLRMHASLRDSSSTRRKTLRRCTSFGIFLLWLCAIGFAQETPQDKPAASMQHPDILRKFPLTEFYDSPVPLPSERPGDLIRSAPFEQYAVSMGVSAVRILYYSRSAAGDPVAVSGVVLIPDGQAPAGGWPVIAWAHKLSGAARTCAPSLARNLLHGPFLSMYVNLGYAVVATDYAGLGTNFRNAFADSRSNALDVIYSIAAARTAVPGLGARWIAMGTEEGAMAAVGVAELEHELQDRNYLGAVAISGVTDLEDMLKPTSNEPHELPLLLAFGVQTAYPQFNVKDVLTDQALLLYREVGHACSVPDAEKVPVAGMLKAHWESNKFVQNYLNRGRLGMEPATGPLLVIGSKGDQSIAATVKVVARLCKQGDRVLFNRYAEYDPGKVIGDSARDQIAWIQERFANRPARSNCADNP